MEKRKVIIGNYDSDLDGLWTLTGLDLSDPEYQSNFQDIPGRDGPLDLSTALTDGEPRYKSRTLTATFESSEGTRQDREERISIMVNWLDGWRMNIQHPDMPGYYLNGRVRVSKNFNDLAHARVTVTAICDPWFYSQTPRVYTVIATSAPQVLALSNKGRRTVTPQITVTGENAAITIQYGTASMVLSAGKYNLVNLLVPAGSTLVTYSGTGTAEITYREAVLR